MIHGSMIGASAQIDKTLKEARDHGQFMSVVWFVDDKGILHCKKTTWQFPNDRLAEATGLLQKMIEDDLTPPKMPLPLASFLSNKFEPFNGKMVIPPRPIEQDESVSDCRDAPPIVNAVLGLDSEDGE